MINAIIVVLAQYLIFFMLMIAGFVWIKSSPFKRKQSIIYGALMLLLGLVAIYISSKLFYDPRPFMSQHIQPLFYHAADNGFPSDHATLGILLALTVYQMSKRYGSTLFVMAIIVGVARVLAHVHSPIDIAAAIVLGCIINVIVLFVTPQLYRLLDHKFGFSFS